jgi:hypothetical protein
VSVRSLRNFSEVFVALLGHVMAFDFVALESHVAAIRFSALTYLTQILVAN